MRVSESTSTQPFRQSLLMPCTWGGAAGERGLHLSQWPVPLRAYKVSLQEAKTFSKRSILRPVGKIGLGFQFFMRTFLNHLVLCCLAGTWWVKRCPESGFIKREIKNAERKVGGKEALFSGLGSRTHMNSGIRRPSPDSALPDSSPAVRRGQ